MANPDGGPAFPCDPCIDSRSETGMTLRDYFAGQAVIGMITLPADRTLSFEVRCDLLADMAYELADAMLKAREG